MAYIRLRPRSGDDAQRDRAAESRAGAYDEYRHDTRDSPFRAPPGGAGAPATVPGATATPEPPMRSEVLRVAVAGGAGGGSTDHSFRIVAYYDNGEAEVVHGPITLAQGGAASPVRITGMAYGLGGTNVSPQPSYLYLLDEANRRLVPYDLSTGEFGHSLTTLPDSLRGVTVAEPVDEPAGSLYMVGARGPTSARTGRLWHSSRLSAAPFLPSVPALLHASNTDPTGIAYVRGPSESTSYVWVTDSNGHIYRYTELDLSVRLLARSGTAVPGSEYDLAPLGGTPGNRYPNAVAYGLRITGDMSTEPRLYVADNTARRIFAYALPGTTDTALPRRADEDILYGEDGLGVGTGSVFGLASFPTSVEAAAHANMAIPHGPPPIPRGTPRIALLTPMDRIAILALTTPPRLQAMPMMTGRYTQRFGSNTSNIRRSTSDIRNATYIANGVVSAGGGVFGIVYSATAATASTWHHWNSWNALTRLWGWNGATVAALRIRHVSSFRPRYVITTPSTGRGRWTYEATEDVTCALAPRRAGARQSAIPLPIAVAAGAYNAAANKFAFAGLRSASTEGTQWSIYTVPVPRAGQQSVEFEDRWDMRANIQPTDISFVRTAAGTRLASVTGRREIEFYTPAGTFMPGETVRLTNLISEAGDGGSLTSSTIYRAIADAFGAP